MSDWDWETTKNSFPPETRVRGRVVDHRPFGVFLDLGHGALGLIRITDLVQPPKRMTPEDYPAMDSEVEATVLGFTDHNQQIILTCLPLLTDGT